MVGMGEAAKGMQAIQRVRHGAHPAAMRLMRVWNRVAGHRVAALQHTTQSPIGLLRN